MLTKAILFAAALLVLDGRMVVAQSTASPVPEAGDTSRHRLGMVTVNGVRVPYLDWGGSGPALVFIPGMGGTAHVFDDFAPRFVDQFRVVGVTRIGFGESDQPEREGYDLASRVAHIRAALDALGIAKAALIGHSLGGDEITAFAVAHPERTSGLVYLDAAIDHTAALRWQQEFGSSYAPPPLGTRVQRATAETYRQYLRDIMGVEFPLGEVLALTRLDPAGLRRMRDTSKATAGIHANTVSPEFGKVQAPVLALYWDVSAQDAFPWLQGEAAERAASVYIGRQRPEMLIERQRFAAALKGARIAADPGHHYEFLRTPDATAKRVREFLVLLK
jgi:non-heme chloroperoxidase